MHKQTNYPCLSRRQNVFYMPAELRDKIAKEAYNSIRSNYSTKKMCDRTIALYREFINQK